MLIRKIKYTDFDGNEREEEFYFNLTKTEVTEWLTTNGDYTLDRVIGSLAKKRNAKEIMEAMKDLILRSYGEKSLDGRRFIKSPELSADFASTNAFSDLFMELLTDADKAADFINKIIPKDLADAVEKEQANIKTEN